MNYNLHKYFLFILLSITLCSGQVNLSIAEYRPFPEKLSLLDFEPTKMSWSIANRFLLLDEHKRELLELGTFGDVNLAGGLGQKGNFDYQDIRDDRVLTYFPMSPGQTKTFVVRLNASYAGRFYLPVVNAEAMYDARIHSRTPGRWVEVYRPGLSN